MLEIGRGTGGEGSNLLRIQTTQAGFYNLLSEVCHTNEFGMGPEVLVKGACKVDQGGKWESLCSRQHVLGNWLPVLD